MKQAPGVSAKLRILRTEQAGLPFPLFHPVCLLLATHCNRRGPRTHLGVNAIKPRQQYDTLLLVRIGAGNHRNAAFRIAEIIGQMRHTSGDIDKVPGRSGEVFFEAFPIPHAGLAA